MRLGVDFDNTIVCYDRLFYELATERQWIEETVPANKTRIRDDLRGRGQEERWTELQGIAYGAEIERAVAFPGVLEFFTYCRDQPIDVFIVSHRTRLPVRGPQVDMHAAARRWLSARGILELLKRQDDQQRVYFEPTRQAKLARIVTLGCDCFIDDLSEFLTDAEFPRSVERILFDPHRQSAAVKSLRQVHTWREVLERLGGQPAPKEASP